MVGITGKGQTLWKNPGAFGANSQCKEIKGLSVKKQVLGEATEAENNIVIAVDRGVPEAVGRTAEQGVGVPRAAAQQLHGNFIRYPGATICWGIVIAFVPVIQTPFPYISMHIL
jgi:hypothetical protein